MEKGKTSQIPVVPWWFPCSMPIARAPSMFMSSKNFSPTSTRGWIALRLTTATSRELFRSRNFRKRCRRWENIDLVWISSFNVTTTPRWASVSRRNSSSSWFPCKARTQPKFPSTSSSFFASRFRDSPMHSDNATLSSKDQSPSASRTSSGSL